MRNLKYFYVLAVVLSSTILFVSCEEKDDDVVTDDATVNQWIFNTLKSDYLWNDEVKAKTPNYSQDPESFFYSLLSLKDGKTKNGTHHYYSYIEENKNYKTKMITSESTYGFEFIIFNLMDENGTIVDYNYGKVLYILPGSPAEKSGLLRGDVLMNINNKKINSGNWNSLLSGPGMTLEIYRTTEPDQDKRKKTITLTASIPMDENPLLKDTVLQVNGKNVGYLIYNHFTTGPKDDGKETVYGNQMKAIFTKYKTAKVKEFVLDLRYNGGGYLSCAQLLSGLLVPQDNQKSIFCYLEDNKGNKENYSFMTDGASLNLSRLYVLVSSASASASEAVINGLKPYMDVILIGEQTEGKNVGSVHYEESKYKWALQPIVSKIYNSRKESNYASGFVPDYYLTEFDDLNTPFYPLGDKRELLLNEALNLMSGSILSAKTTKSNTQDVVIYNSVDRKQTNAVIIR